MYKPIEILIIKSDNQSEDALFQTMQLKTVFVRSVLEERTGCS